MQELVLFQKHGRITPNKGFGVKSIGKEADEMTDVGSLCSGLSDLSGVSDLEDDFHVIYPDSDEAERKQRRAKTREKRLRGVRAGKKHQRKLRSVENDHSVVTGVMVSDTTGVVEFASKNSRAKKSMWRRKLQQKRRIKHQQ